jgi:hypothetical protein
MRRFQLQLLRNGIIGNRPTTVLESGTRFVPRALAAKQLTARGAHARSAHAGRMRPEERILTRGPETALSPAFRSETAGSRIDLRVVRVAFVSCRSFRGCSRHSSSSACFNIPAASAPKNSWAHYPLRSDPRFTDLLRRMNLQP